MKCLIIAEKNHETLHTATLHAITAAQNLQCDIDLLIAGTACQAVAECASLLPVKQVLVAENSVYEYQLAENTAQLIAEVGKTYDYLLAASTTFSKNLLPRVAALLDVGMVSDVTQILSANTFVRPMYAGNVMATVQSHDRIKVLSIRTTAFRAIDSHPQIAAPIHTLPQVIANTTSRFESQELTHSTRPDLTSARIVISGGRGLKSADNFHLIEQLADQLGAAVGASRAAVDAGFAPNDYQVGQTGKVVAPDLYIAIGISGAIQHLAGMKDSKVIVAINNDADAPIFQVADYGLVGDLFTLLPELQEALKDQK